MFYYQGQEHINVDAMVPGHSEGSSNPMVEFHSLALH